MSDVNVHNQPGSAAVVVDELELMQEWLPLQGATILDLGCGKAVMSRRLLADAGAARVVGLDTDRVQVDALLASELPAGLTIQSGGAEAIPFPDATFDIVAMFKSLHHVPVAQMDTALAEVARVLCPQGLLYVSEPVFAGELNEIMRLFHDEGHVRAEALAAMARAVDRGLYTQVNEYHFSVPVRFRDFDDFQRRHINVTHTEHRIAPDVMARIRAKFTSHIGDDGAAFERPMRINVLRKNQE